MRKEQHRNTRSLETTSILQGKRAVTSVVAEKWARYLRSKRAVCHRSKSILPDVAAKQFQNIPGIYQGQSLQGLVFFRGIPYNNVTVVVTTLKRYLGLQHCNALERQRLYNIYDIIIHHEILQF